MESAESYRQLNYLEMMWGILEYFRLKRENVSKKDHFNHYLPPWAGAHANPPAFVSSGGGATRVKRLSQPKAADLQLSPVSPPIKRVNLKLEQTLHCEGVGVGGPMTMTAWCSHKYPLVNISSETGLCE